MKSITYTNKPVVTMKEKPTENSKNVSQTFFSEQVTIKEKQDDWVFITTSDGYKGWVLEDCLIKRKKPYLSSLTTSRLAAHLYHVKDTEYGPIKTLPYGSKLSELDSSDPRWIKVALLDESKAYIQRGDVALEKKLFHKKELTQFSSKFMGLPYTWGGRSSFGYDCSGFVQMLYKQIGISLKRDSKEQIIDPRFQTIALEKIQPGDLIFWGKSKKSITHVGMYLKTGKFIHSVVLENKPWIRVSDLSEETWKEGSSSHPYLEIRQLL